MSFGDWLDIWSIMTKISAFQSCFKFICSVNSDVQNDDSCTLITQSSQHNDSHSTSYKTDYWILFIKFNINVTVFLVFKITQPISPYLANSLYALASVRPAIYNASLRPTDCCCSPLSFMVRGRSWLCNLGCAIHTIKQCANKSRGLC